jgi:gll3707 protein
LEKESFRGNFINDASPVEFLNYMYHASAVMTDGYHGTVFSTIFNKPMYSVINNRQSTDSRIRDYLTLIGLESRIFYGDAPVIPKEEIDYTEVDPKIRSAADASKAFLQSAIDNERVVR